MNSNWARLPEHLLDLVLEGLVLPLDYLHFSLVCRPWHAVAKHNKTLSARMSTSSHNPPMLLVHSEEDGIWGLYNAMDDKVLGLQFELGNVRFCGSSKGWLIVVENDFTVTLVNPFLRFKGSRKIEDSIIRLPEVTLAWPRSYPNHRVHKATISADPISNTNGCIVAVIYEDRCRLAIIRLGEDTTWTYVDETYGLINEVVFVENRIYALDSRKGLLYFDITTHSKLDVKRVVSYESRRRPFMVKTYLVALNDREIWAVERHMFWDDDDKRWTEKFEVFAFDFIKVKWIKKETIGDGALFVGDNSSLYVLASECKGCQPNCIYFSYDAERLAFDCEPHVPSDFGVYDIKNGCVSQPYTVKKANRPPIWLVPKLEL